MRIRLTKLWESVSASYWFVPTLMAVLSVVLALAMLAVDRGLGPEVLRDVGWVYTGGADGARELLATVAGSMITVAGVVLSITIVVLSLASSQLGPRILRNFMGDRPSQVVLGTFTATYLYSLVVLRTIRGDGDDFDAFVPEVSVTVGVLLAAAALGVLIYFVHHVALLIQAPHAVASVAREMDATIERMFPSSLGRPAPERDSVRDVPPRFGDEAAPVSSSGTGYLQAVDVEKLIDRARERDVLVRLLPRPGHFVFEGAELARVWPADRLDAGLAEKINEALILGPERTPTQDVEFAVRQMVEIAVRALSPGLNDPFTAVTCIDQMGARLLRLARCRFPDGFRYDDGGQLRVITNPNSFEGVMDAAFDQLRQNAGRVPAVLIRILETLAVLGAHATDERARESIRRHAVMVHRAAHAGVEEPWDLRDVDERFDAVLQALERGAEVHPG
ncbi:MAG TPA: DUF2254 domain-containing protein [Longimicrobiaceae bacterium]|nr:DUF2254 domain-containing protein [Longimicrobiaceae bacterium]